MSIETLRNDRAKDGRRPRWVSLTLIMPGLNEETNIENAVGRSLAALERLTDEFEIILINDGSTDRTGELADRLAAQNKRVRVLHNERNVNYGISLRRGIQAARCDWILHNGMDLPLEPEDIGKFVPYFDSADVIAARRVSRSAHSPWRRLTSWVNNMLLRILFAPRTADLNFVQFYRRTFVQSLQPIATSPAFVAPELILRAEKTGARVREVSVEFRRRESGTAHFGRVNDIAWTLADMIRLRFIVWFRGWN